MSETLDAVAGMVPQPHGGALARGGIPGNKGGGRRPDRIRRMAQRALLKRVPLLAHLADGVAVEFTDDGATRLISPTPGERIRAMEALHKLASSPEVNVALLRERLAAQVRVIRSRAQWTPDELLAELSPVWR